ncbi:MAG: hypothetical protein HW410_1517 [Nitrosarchaeum sp.]|nr:hypothetical protein [Nitrosarchaeum sp.]
MRLKSGFENVHQETIDKMEKSGIIIFSQKPLTHSLTSFCPQCHNHGIPKIEKKNADDNRIRTGAYDIPKIPLHGESDFKLKKHPKLYLAYTHGKCKKCWIKQYEDLPEPRLVESKHTSKKIVGTNPYLHQNILETLQKKFGIRHS